jgi:hypothetical protein
MPFEVVLDTTLSWVTLMPGKGALGTWRSSVVNDASRRSHDLKNELRGKPGWVGVYASERLSLRPYRKDLVGKCQGQNRNREIRPSGIAGGPRET